MTPAPCVRSLRWRSGDHGRRCCRMSARSNRSAWRCSARSTRPAVIELVQLIDRKGLVGEPSLRLQLEDEHLAERRKAAELPLFDQREPGFHIRVGAPQAVVGKRWIAGFGHRRVLSPGVLLKPAAGTRPGNSETCLKSYYCHRPAPIQRLV